MNDYENIIKNYMMRLDSEVTRQSSGLPLDKMILFCFIEDLDKDTESGILAARYENEIERVRGTIVAERCVYFLRVNEKYDFTRQVEAVLQDASYAKVLHNVNDILLVPVYLAFPGGEFPTVLLQSFCDTIERFTLNIQILPAAIIRTTFVGGQQEKLRMFCQKMQSSRFRFFQTLVLTDRDRRNLSVELQEQSRALFLVAMMLSRQDRWNENLRVQQGNAGELSVFSASAFVLTMPAHALALTSLQSCLEQLLNTRTESINSVAAVSYYLNNFIRNTLWQNIAEKLPVVNGQISTAPIRSITIPNGTPKATMDQIYQDFYERYYLSKLPVNPEYLAAQGKNFLDLIFGAGMLLADFREFYTNDASRAEVIMQIPKLPVTNEIPYQGHSSTEYEQKLQKLLADREQQAARAFMGTRSSPIVKDWLSALNQMAANYNEIVNILTAEKQAWEAKELRLVNYTPAIPTEQKNQAAPLFTELLTSGNVDEVCLKILQFAYDAAKDSIQQGMAATYLQEVSAEIVDAVKQHNEESIRHAIDEHLRLPIRADVDPEKLRGKTWIIGDNTEKLLDNIAAILSGERQTNEIGVQDRVELLTISRVIGLQKLFI